MALKRQEIEGSGMLVYDGSINVFIVSVFVVLFFY